MRILLVEDDLELGAALVRGFEQEGFAPVWVRRLAEARLQLQREIAVVVLDVNLPDGSGFELVGEMRGGDDRTPVIVMTARDALEDRLHGLDSGADDYVVKPFSTAELIARTRVAVRRASGFALDVWTLGDVTVDVSRHAVSVAGAPVALTPTEYRLLVELARHPGRVLGREVLIERLWSASEEVTDSVLEYHVHGLRRKLGAHRIRTFRGSGYAVVAE